MTLTAAGFESATGTDFAALEELDFIAESSPFFSSNLAILFNTELAESIGETGNNLFLLCSSDFQGINDIANKVIHTHSSIFQFTQNNIFELKNGTDNIVQETLNETNKISKQIKFQERILLTARFIASLGILLNRDFSSITTVSFLDIS